MSLALGLGIGIPFGGSDNIWAKGFPFALDFANSRYLGLLASRVACTRALANSTSLLPSSPAGAPVTVFAANTPRLVPGVGLIIEEARTNNLLNSRAPVTQTTASLGTGLYALWVNGSGSATPSGGTATITGAAAAVQGAPNLFNVTVAGTVVVTVAGSLNAFQLELATAGFGTSLIVTTGATALRAVDGVTLSTPPAFGPAYTLFAKGSSLGFDSTRVMLNMDDNTANNRVRIGQSTTGIFGDDTVATVSQDFLQTASHPAANVVFSMAHASALNDFATSLNGAAVLTAPAGTTPAAAITRFGIGSGAASGQPWCGVLSMIAFDPKTRRSNSDLRVMTT